MAKKSIPNTQSTTTQPVTTQSTPAQTSPAVVQPPSPPPPIVGTAGSGNSKKVTLLASVQALIVGLQQYYQPGDVFQLAGGPMTRDELIADLQSFISAAVQTSAANAAWRGAIQAERALEAHIREERGQVKGIVVARFGKSAAQLMTFGYLPQKARSTKASTTAIAVVKRAATRTARNTMGKVQKQDVHGDVTAEIVVTPGGSKAAASASPAPVVATPTVVPVVPAASVSVAPVPPAASASPNTANGNK